MIETPSREPKLFDTGSLIGGRYEVVGTIGSGAMGWVLHVIDRSLGNRSVALKLLYPHLVQDKSTFARFQNEVLVTRELNHPNIVKVYDLGSTESGLYFITMELVNGTSLKDLIYNGSGKGLPFADAVRVLYQVSEGVAHAHSRGVIHRDLKPDNILISRLGEVKIVDFGIARSLWQENGLTKTGGAVGTPYYMAPEQILGEPADHRADIYSLGIIAYELVAGARPFDDACFYNLAQKHFLENVPDLATSTSGIPLWYHDLVKRCAAKAKEERFNSTEELADLLRTHVPEGHIQPQRRAAYSSVSEMVLNLGRKAKSFNVPAGRAFYLPWLVIAFIFCGVALGFLRTNSTIRAQTLWPLLKLEHSLGVELVLLKKLFNVRIFSEAHTQLLSIDRPSDLLDAIDGGIENEGDKFAIRLLMLSGMDPDSVRDAEGRTALEYALYRGKDKAVGELIRHGADPNIRDENGRSRIIHAINSYRPKLVKQLLQDADIDLSVTDEDGNTPLHIAALRGDEELLRVMLESKGEQGADVRALNKKGQTPLMVAVSRLDWQERTVSVLIDHDSPTETRDNQGRTIFDLTPEPHHNKLRSLLEVKRATT